MKTKLTSELQKNLIKCIRAGSYIVVACKAVGITEKTFYEWIKKGEKGIEPYSKLSKSIKKAQERAELRNIITVQNAAKENWVAAMTFLERKYPQRLGKKDKLEVKTKKTVESKHFIEINQKIEKLSPTERKQLITLAIKAEKEFMEPNKDINNRDSKNG